MMARNNHYIYTKHNALAYKLKTNYKSKPIVTTLNLYTTTGKSQAVTMSP